jgi:hypothetical protein
MRRKLCYCVENCEAHFTNILHYKIVVTKQLQHFSFFNFISEAEIEVSRTQLSLWFSDYA